MTMAQLLVLGLKLSLILMVFALGILGLWLQKPLVALALPLIYLLALIAGGLSLARKEGPAVACSHHPHRPSTLHGQRSRWSCPTRYGSRCT